MSQSGVAYTLLRASYLLRASAAGRQLLLLFLLKDVAGAISATFYKGTRAVYLSVHAGRSQPRVQYRVRAERSQCKQ